MNYAIVSCSLNPKSRSRILAREAEANFKAEGVDVSFYDLADYRLPLCDGGSCYGSPEVQKIKSELIKADGIILATPIYTFYSNAAAKNLIELTGRDVWTEKVTAFLCAAGGQGSYMSIMSLASSLMLDFRTYILPRFVYATGDCFDESSLISSEVKGRVEQLSSELRRITQAIRGS